MSDVLLEILSAHCRNLLAAVLERAIFDLSDSESPRLREAAQRFFADTKNTEEPFSFFWICSELSISPTMFLSSVVNPAPGSYGRKKEKFRRKAA